MTEQILDQYQQAISAHFPDLPIGSIFLLREGWANRLCLVNHTIVFRFPLDSYSEGQLLREIRLLPVLAPELPLPIPNYTYIAPASEAYPYSFVGYPFIPGISIPQPSEALRQAQWWRPQVGKFLTALHRIPVDRVVATDLEGYQTAQAWRDALATKHEPFARYVFPFLAAWQRKAIARYLNEAIHDERMVAFLPVVLHQDFDFHNFLIDLETQQVTGVVDFGACSIGDPAVDISPEILPYYGGVIDPGWDFRRDYYIRTSALEDLLYICTCEHELPNGESARDRKLLEIERIWSE